ncbi:hypothetical protein VTL71DRAFT_11711 [Oculimacula yallundae]|uniref:Uncharacterized protein n=1 Tax=Oculimacula yallundae TaxID=86028 RepID=A0ABR4CSP4_9HELO
MLHPVFLVDGLVPIPHVLYHGALQDKKKIHRYLEYSSSTESPQLALLYVWMFAHAFFAMGMFLTFFVISQNGRMILVTSIGFPWAVTLWVPCSRIGVILSNGSHATPEIGSVMGPHNSAISAPQIVSALISSFVFA